MDTTDIDEALARQLVFEDQQEQRARRHATGESWPRREDPLQADGHAPYQPRRRGEVPPEEARTDFQEIQRTMNQIAESGKRTFSSIVSRVKAKINEYEQSRCVSTVCPPACTTSPSSARLSRPFLPRVLEELC